jgi:predicted ATP-binding protein involved in virulence
MRIRHFSATGVHGYLKFDIKFNKDITFLTGINGSGKTSVVYSIVSLITPSLFILANLEFAHMKVVVDQDDETITIEAKRTDNIVSLTTSKTEDAFIIPKFIPEPDDPPLRVSDAEYSSIVI